MFYIFAIAIGLKVLDSLITASDTNGNAKALCKQAQDKLESAEQEFEGKKNEFKCKVDNFNAHLQSLQTKLIPIFETASKLIATKEQLKNKFLAVNMRAYDYMQTSYKFELNSAVGSAVTALAIGTAGAMVTPAALMAFATAFGTTSTGVAISSLSGIAAQNAALSWLGGSALSAGGMGIAGGLQLIGYASLGVGLLIGGLVMEAEASENYAKAQKFSSEVDLHVQKIKEKILMIDTYISKINNIIKTSNNLASMIFKCLSDVRVDNLRTQHDVEQIYKAMVLYTTLQDIVKINIKDLNLERLNKLCEDKLSEVQALVDKI